MENTGMMNSAILIVCTLIVIGCLNYDTPAMQPEGGQDMTVTTDKGSDTPLDMSTGFSDSESSSDILLDGGVDAGAVLDSGSKE